MFVLKRLVITAFLVVFLSSCITPYGSILSSSPGSGMTEVPVEHIVKPPQTSQDNHETGLVEEDLSEEPVLSDADISAGENSAEPNAPEQVDPNGKNHVNQNNKQAIMDEALDFLSQAQLLWEKGEIDKALKLLDETYSLLLDVNGDPEITWQKDDLRVMIAKKIVEI
ncbi:MAG: hypothetical protein KAT81_00860, partial [Syntrophobacterales bacterium]|nr:hypothetical protein [Syntrophobacterales bacterium]